MYANYSICSFISKVTLATKSTLGTCILYVDLSGNRDYIALVYYRQPIISSIIGQITYFEISTNRKLLHVNSRDNVVSVVHKKLINS